MRQAKTKNNGGSNVDEPILKMQGIEKRFPGVIALHNASLNVRKGQIMALLGENGAGKSTLMKVLTGVYKRDGGTIVYKGKQVEYQNTRQAMDDGIAIIHQELTLVPKMTIYENIFMGSEKTKGLGIADKKYMIQKSRELLHTLNMDLNPEKRIETLSIAQQQMVEIAKVLLYDAQVIVMDEPTDVLPDEEVESLFRVLEDLKKRGKAIIYC